MLQPPPAKQRPEDAREDSGRQSSPAPSAGGVRAATPPSGLKRALADAPTARSRLPSAERSADSRAAGRSSSAAPEKKAASGSGLGAKGRNRSTVEVNARCTNRSGGDARVRLQQPLKQPPPGNTVQQAHKLTTLQGTLLTFACIFGSLDMNAASVMYQLGCLSSTVLLQVSVSTRQ